MQTHTFEEWEQLGAVTDDSREVVAAPCAHHWKITTPGEGPMHGVCKLCGAERDYDDSAISFKYLDAADRGRTRGNLRYCA